MNDDLISRKALKKEFETLFYNDCGDFVRTERLIDDAPTVERIVCRSRYWSNDCTHSSSFEQGYVQGYEEGKNDRPKGKWVTDELHNTVCSICGGIRRDSRFDYIDFCNKCGAKMIKEGNND